MPAVAEQDPARRTSCARCVLCYPIQFSTSSPLRHHLSTLIKAAVTIGLIAFFAHKVDLDDLLQRLRSVGILAVVEALGMTFLLSVIQTLRWRIVLRTLGTAISGWKLLRYTQVGLFFNSVLPSGVGGDIFRAVLARRAGAPLRLAAASVVLDRLMALIALVLFVAIASPFLLQMLQHGLEGWLIVMATGAGTLGIAFLLVFHHLLGWLGTSVVGRLRARLPVVAKRGIDFLDDVSRNAFALLANRRCGPAVMGFSLLSQLGMGFTIYIFAHALSAPATLGMCLALFPPAMLIGMLPISLGGWGVREGAMVLFFGLVGVGTNDALGMSILYGIILTVAGLPGGLIWILNRHGETNISQQELDSASLGVGAAE